MRLPRPTKVNQRVLSSAVIGLLAANAFAAAVIAGDVGGDRVAPVVTEATAEPAGVPQTVTLITTADGRRLLADPATAEGRKAIADAKRNGGTVQDVTIPATSPSSGGGRITIPGKVGGSSPVDLNDLLTRLTTTGDGGGVGTSTTTGAGGPGPGVVEIGENLVRDLLSNPGGTITSVVGSTQSTITSVVGSTQSTISSVVASTPSTVTSVVGGVQSTVTSLLNQVPTTPAPPATSLLGSIITTVSTTVQSVTPTTSAPPPPPPTTVPGPLCGLLAHC